jgi:hypothetical protein
MVRPVRYKIRFILYGSYLFALNAMNALQLAPRVAETETNIPIIITPPKVAPWRSLFLKKP